VKTFRIRRAKTAKVPIFAALQHQTEVERVRSPAGEFFSQSARSQTEVGDSAPFSAATQRGEDDWTRQLPEIREAIGTCGRCGAFAGDNNVEWSD
jgi:hypothetical protein